MPKVLIADDSSIIRKVLKSMLSELEGWLVCGEAVNGQQAILMANQLKPELIILDLAMPLLDGLHAAVEILKSAPSVPIVLYTLHKTQQIDLEAKKAGLKAVISKSEDSSGLLETLQRIYAEAQLAAHSMARSETLLAAVSSPPKPAAKAPESVLAPASAESKIGSKPCSLSASATSSEGAPAATSHSLGTTETCSPKISDSKTSADSASPSKA